jgi:hypothetical protein
MTFWLDLFTGTTWQEFIDHGSKVSGFRESKTTTVKKIKKGDILLCYLTGVQRWVGALEVLSLSKDTSKIWTFDQFPARLDVKPLVQLAPEHGVPMSELEGKVSFFEGPQQKGKYKGFVRSSPAKFASSSDGPTILSLLHAAESSKIVRPVDPKLLAKKPLYDVSRPEGKTLIETQVSIPEPEEKLIPKFKESSTQHTEIQHQLLKLGHGMGFDVWVARNDRSRLWKGDELGKLPGIVTELPTQFNEATNRTIELIDVLWLKGNSIIAAFEVECTTSVYSGLLRMSDLLALQPNLEINLYLVAPDERREKVSSEILRPTFGLRDKPLADTCGFISIGSLLAFTKSVNELDIVGSLKPDVLDRIAEYFG